MTARAFSSSTPPSFALALAAALRAVVKGSGCTSPLAAERGYPFVHLRALDLGRPSAGFAVEGTDGHRLVIAGVDAPPSIAPLDLDRDDLGAYAHARQRAQGSRTGGVCLTVEAARDLEAALLTGEHRGAAFETLDDVRAFLLRHEMRAPSAGYPDTAALSWLDNWATVDRRDLERAIRAVTRSARARAAVFLAEARAEVKAARAAHKAADARSKGALKIALFGARESGKRGAVKAARQAHASSALGRLAEDARLALVDARDDLDALRTATARDVVRLAFVEGGRLVVDHAPRAGIDAAGDALQGARIAEAVTLDACLVRGWHALDQGEAASAVYLDARYLREALSAFAGHAEVQIGVGFDGEAVDLRAPVTIGPAPDGGPVEGLHLKAALMPRRS